MIKGFLFYDNKRIVKPSQMIKGFLFYDNKRIVKVSLKRKKITSLK